MLLAKPVLLAVLEQLVLGLWVRAVSPPKVVLLLGVPELRPEQLLVSGSKPGFQPGGGLPELYLVLWPEAELSSRQLLLVTPLRKKQVLPGSGQAVSPKASLEPVLPLPELQLVLENRAPKATSEQHQRGSEAGPLLPKPLLVRRLVPKPGSEEALRRSKALLRLLLLGFQAEVWQKTPQRTPERPVCAVQAYARGPEGRCHPHW